MSGGFNLLAPRAPNFNIGERPEPKYQKDRKKLQLNNYA